MYQMIFFREEVLFLRRLCMACPDLNQREAKALGLLTPEGQDFKKICPSF